MHDKLKFIRLPPRYNQPVYELQSQIWNFHFKQLPCSGVKKFLKNHELYHHRDFCVLGFCSKFQTTVFVICPGFDCLAKIVFGNLTALCSVSQTRIDRWTKFERRNLKNSWYPNGNTFAKNRATQCSTEIEEMDIDSERDLIKKIEFMWLPRNT